MNRFIKTIVATTIGLATSIAMAASPRQLITHNQTDVESNAFIAGTIPSQHPTKAHSDSKVIWASVRMACFGHTTGGKCWATIKMATDTNNPIEIGQVSIDLETGQIYPSQISANGYTLTAVGLGETTITKSNP